jgi:hypothetical protein
MNVVPAADPSIEVQPIPNLEVIAQGESNFYVLLDGKRWIAHIQMNGEFTAPMQEAILHRFADALKNPR